MGTVNVLAAGKSPPTDEDYVLVTRLPSGKFEIVTVVQIDDESASFMHSAPLDQPLVTVVTYAEKLAAKMGVLTVYVPS